MRALIGAIISAGAMIGLGLTSLGIGLRYQFVNWKRENSNALYDVKFHEIDNPLQFGMVFLALMALIGLAIAFVGLAYHHERRYREAQLGANGTTGTTRVSVPE
jgi:formate hydrogenlyase subunit 3/multisubunit Na+/H+ antiporter MnhD subunit